MSTSHTTITRRRFAIAAGTAAVALAACKEDAPATPPAAAESDAEKTVRAFFTKMGESFDGQVEAYRTYFTPETVWIQPGFPDVKGADAAVEVVTGARTKGLETVKIDVVNIASKGDIVHTERMDHMVRADGTNIASLPVAGILTIKDGKIVRWIEYFDPRQVLEIFAAL